MILVLELSAVFLLRWCSFLNFLLRVLFFSHCNATAALVKWLSAFERHLRASANYTNIGKSGSAMPVLVHARHAVKVCLMFDFQHFCFNLL